MRILHVAYIYPPKLRVADGITNVVCNVTKELANRGHEVAVYTSDMLNLHGKDYLGASSLIVNGVDVHYAHSVLNYETFMITPSLVLLLSRSIADFDVIHIHDCRSFQGIATYLFAKTKDIPFVFQPHGSYLPSLPESNTKTIAKFMLDKLMSGKIFHDSSKIIALSQMEANQYQRAGVPDERIAIVPNGIDLSEYRDLPPKGSFKKKLNLPGDKNMILYLGRVHKTKGIDLLIRAYAYLVKNMKCDDCILAIVGPDDGYLAEAKSLAVSLGLSDSVLFTGFLDSKDKLEALVDAEVFVTPSFYGFPITFLEACAVGIPIVTTTLGDKLEWIDGNIGIVTSPNPLAIAEAMHRVIYDEDLAMKLSINCKKNVEEFSLGKSVDRLEQIYWEVARRDT